MNIFEFLYRLQQFSRHWIIRKSYINRGGAIRIQNRFNFGYYCPITAVAKQSRGAAYEVNEFIEASDAINLSYDQYEGIMTAADCYWLEESYIRETLKSACGIK